MMDEMSKGEKAVTVGGLTIAAFLVVSVIALFIQGCNLNNANAKIGEQLAAVKKDVAEARNASASKDGKSLAEIEERLQKKYDDAKAKEEAARAEKDAAKKIEDSNKKLHEDVRKLLEFMEKAKEKPPIIILPGGDPKEKEKEKDLKKDPPKDKEEKSKGPVKTSFDAEYEVRKANFEAVISTKRYAMERHLSDGVRTPGKTIYDYYWRPFSDKDKENWRKGFNEWVARQREDFEAQEQRIRDAQFRQKSSYILMEIGRKNLLAKTKGVGR